jgi:hypothetical protein
LTADSDNEDERTVSNILEEVEGSAREERKKRSNAISILGAVLLVAAAAYWLFR